MGKSWIWIFVRDRNQDDTFLGDGLSNDENSIQDGTRFERSANIRQMDWHRKVCEDVLLTREAKNEKEDPPCSIEVMKRVGSEFSWLFFLSEAACVPACSL